jgi:hypothetical protein
MGYRSDGDLAGLFPERFVHETSEQIADAVGDRFRDRVAKRTPVARLPKAYRGDFEEWIRDRGGRTPRTMRDSWTRSAVVQTDASSFRVEVFSDEPPDEHGWQKVSYVEEDTKPHLIRAKVRPGPPPYQGSLRFPHGASFAFRIQVTHPGTQGVHMMRDTAAEMEVMWMEIGEAVLERRAQEFNAGGLDSAFQADALRRSP